MNPPNSMSPPNSWTLAGYSLPDLTLTAGQGFYIGNFVTKSYISNSVGSWPSRSNETTIGITIEATISVTTAGHLVIFAPNGSTSDGMGYVLVNQDFSVGTHSISTDRYFDAKWNGIAYPTTYTNPYGGFPGIIFEKDDSLVATLTNINVLLIFIHIPTIVNCI